MSFVNAVARGTTLNEIYPIGSVITKNAPWAGFAGQTWELFSQGKTLVGQDTTDADFSSLGQTGGSKTHTLLETEIPPHTHSYLKADNTLTGYNQNGGGSTFGSYHITNTTNNTGSTGGGQPHSIMNPYQVVLYYRRTA
jgi:microcystin-dependent protein